MDRPRPFRAALFVLLLGGCGAKGPLPMDDTLASDADWFKDPSEDPQPLPPAAPTVCGEVRLSRDVAEMQPSEGWVFILARRGSHQGPLVAGIKMPLGRFPARFCLSQKHLVTRGAAFAGPLFLSARIDGDGLASLEPGDFDGALRTPVAIGAQGVIVPIDTFR